MHLLFQTPTFCLNQNRHNLTQWVNKDTKSEKKRFIVQH